MRDEIEKTLRHCLEQARDPNLNPDGVMKLSQAVLNLSNALASLKHRDWINESHLRQKAKVTESIK